ncbi:esterase [Streptomyces sp. CB02923]|uniref:enterochelin esterase n=1 Tax=Streptomyces sp. CB02923 TaxID=1718985 RepID=UPI00093C09D8|nr:enterochelin esterase [Streptomyces sp. CB02923]OKI02167.1 esterase [Streptomyces sp. CB02923]
MTVTAPPSGSPRHPPRMPRPSPVPRVTDERVVRRAAGMSGAEFWRAVEREGTPLTGPDPEGAADHAVVTFLWRGSPATRAVLVSPNKIADPRDPSGNLMDRVPGTDVWHWSVRMRRDWHATYTLCVDEGGGPADDAAYWPWLRTQRRSDPYNPHALAGRWDGDPTPCVALSGAPGSTEWRERPGVPRGSVSVHSVRSALLGNERRVWRYVPAGGVEPGAELPVLVLLDGEMWQPGLGVATLLDNLVADGRIPPLAALLPESLGADTRWAEMTCDPRFAGFLADELLPWAGADLPLTADPARTVVAGQSLGGLTAAYAAVTAPGRFGCVLAQSGSFWWPNGPGAQWLTERIAASPRLPVRFRLAAGEQEWVALPANRRLRDTLAAKGYDDAVYREYNGGHDYLCWRTELAEGLCDLLGPGTAGPVAG